MFSYVYMFYCCCFFILFYLFVLFCFLGGGATNPFIVLFNIFQTKAFIQWTCKGATYWNGHFTHCYNLVSQSLVFIPSVNVQISANNFLVINRSPLRQYSQVSADIRGVQDFVKCIFFAKFFPQTLKISSSISVCLYISELLYWNIIKMAVKTNTIIHSMSSTQLWRSRCNLPSYKKQEVQEALTVTNTVSQHRIWCENHHVSLNIQATRQA